MSLSSDQVAFLARFSKSPDCAALLQILNAEVAEVNAMLRQVRGEDLFVAQGKAQQLDRLIDLLTKQSTVARSSPRPVRQAALTV
jgi:hypothetical protein